MANYGLYPYLFEKFNQALYLEMRFEKKMATEDVHILC